MLTTESPFASTARALTSLTGPQLLIYSPLLSAPALRLTLPPIRPQAASKSAVMASDWKAKATTVATTFVAHPAVKTIVEKQSELAGKTRSYVASQLMKMRSPTEQAQVAEASV